MWDYLVGLPSALSVTIVILGLTSVVIISLKGTAVVRWGKNLVGLGGAKITETTEEGIIDTEGENPAVTSPTRTTIIRMRKRMCGDCILIVMSEREKYELKISSTQDQVLRNQMNFFEQKMEEIQEIIEKVFSDLMEAANRKAGVVPGKSTDIESRLFSELLKDSLLTIKSEIRRSYKENGYLDMEDSDFSIYLKEKNRLIVNTLVQYIKNMYPLQNMTVPFSDIQSNLLYIMPKMYDILRACFEYSKVAIREAQDQIATHHKEFSAWVDKFISEK